MLLFRGCSAIWAWVPVAYLPAFLLWKYEGCRARTFWEKSGKCYLSYSCLIFGEIARSKKSSSGKKNQKDGVELAIKMAVTRLKINMSPALPTHHKMDIIRYLTDLWTSFVQIRARTTPVSRNLVIINKMIFLSILHILATRLWTVESSRKNIFGFNNTYLSCEYNLRFVSR